MAAISCFREIFSCSLEPANVLSSYTKGVKRFQDDIFHWEMRSIPPQVTNSHITPLYPLASVGIELATRKRPL